MRHHTRIVRSSVRGVMNLRRESAWSCSCVVLGASMRTCRLNGSLFVGSRGAASDVYNAFDGIFGNHRVLSGVDTRHGHNDRCRVCCASKRVVSTPCGNSRSMIELTTLSTCEMHPK